MHAIKIPPITGSQVTCRRVSAVFFLGEVPLYEGGHRQRAPTEGLRRERSNALSFLAVMLIGMSPQVEHTLEARRIVLDSPHSLTVASRYSRHHQ